MRHNEGVSRDFFTYTSDESSGTRWLKLRLKEARRRPAEETDAVNVYELAVFQVYEYVLKH